MLLHLGLCSGCHLGLPLVKPTWLEIPLRATRGTQEVEQVQWPVLSPDMVAMELSRRCPEMLRGQVGEAATFWERFLLEQPGHPIAGVAGPLSHFVPISVHGDEVEGLAKASHRYRSRCATCQHCSSSKPAIFGGAVCQQEPTFVLSWGSLLNKETDTFLSHFLLTVLPTRKCVKVGMRNTTLETIMAWLVQCFTKMFYDESCAVRGAVVVLRGDWKWQVQALALSGWSAQTLHKALCVELLPSLTSLAVRPKHSTRGQVGACKCVPLVPGQPYHAGAALQRPIEAHSHDIFGAQFAKRFSANAVSW